MHHLLTELFLASSASRREIEAITIRVVRRFREIGVPAPTISGLLALTDLPRRSPAAVKALLARSK
jgi:hypothetical protein